MRAFALTRYFSLLSLILLILASTLLGLLLRQQEISLMQGLAEDRNVNLTHIFRNLLRHDIEQLLLRSALIPPAELQDSPDIKRLHEKIGPLIHDSDVVKVKIYNPAGLTILSTETAQIGEDKSSNPGFISARDGQVASELIHRDQFDTFEGRREDLDLMASYIPIFHNGRVIAVFEQYQDVTKVIGLIDQSLWREGAMITVIMGTLYLMLLFVVRRAQAALSVQEARLEAANSALDRRVAERTEELQHSESRIKELLQEQRLIFDNAHVGILLLKNRKVLKSNQRYADMFGFSSPEEYEGCSTEIFYPSVEQFKKAGEIGYGQLATKGCSHFEVEMSRQDGSRAWVIQTGRPLDPHHVLDQPSIWVFMDVTERKQAEAELRISAAAFDSQESIMVTDGDGIILRVNRAFTETTGYTQEEVLGKTPRLLKSGVHDEEFYRDMWESIHKTGGWQGEIWDQRKDGVVYPKWATISAVKNASGDTTHYVGTHYDITERKKAEDRIKELAFFDSLTHLPNRTLLLDRLKQTMTASNRNRTYGAVLFIDLDHFKMLNDTQGHDKGDLLLQQVAQRLSTCVREGDTVARLGGDEFLIVLAGLNGNIDEAANQTECISEKILAALNQTYYLGTFEHRNTASIGATLFCGHETSIDDLLKQADLALYKSKDSGRNTVHFFDQAMQTVVIERAALEKSLRLAIQAQQFVLHYQAQLNGENEIAGAEVLIRWHHPERGMVSPVDFISLAEETGLIIPMGLWVLETACTTLAHWSLHPELATLTLAVNVSARQFHHQDFVESVKAVLQHTGANPRRLKLELTESLLVHNMGEVISKMNTLKEIGISFSLDDFGTGYSSLSYLSRLPLDQLKIDRSFVMNIDANNNAVAICAATISLAHSLKLKVVAEGVETEAQRYFLSTVHRCDFLQGYLFSRPLPLDEFERLASRHAQASRPHSCKGEQQLSKDRKCLAPETC